MDSLKLILILSLAAASWAGFVAFTVYIIGFAAALSR